MKRSTLALGLLATCLALPLAPPASAQPRAGACVVGPGLGSTLLYPYVEVNLDDPNALTTLLAVGNGLNDPILARFVLWSDWGIPTLAFDIYLPGFAVQTVNLRDIFNGIVPSTGGGADLSNFDYCGAYPPNHSNPALTSIVRNQLAAYHTGVAGPLDTHCAGENHGDHVARGYVTVDVVDECSGVEAPSPVFTPANTIYPYFDHGKAAGIAKDDNTLWGDVIYVNSSGGFSQANGAISIWAGDPSTFGPGATYYTFYGRYSGWDGRDDRVPLPYRWDQRFLNGGPLSGGANIIFWQDTASSATNTVACASHPSWWPRKVTANALKENSSGFYDIGNTAFPLATQRVDVSGLGIPYANGWIQLTTAPMEQAWSQSTLTAAGLFSASWDGAPVDFLCGFKP